MTLSRKNPRAKKRWLGLIVAVATLTLIIGSMAQAVHDEGIFQLDDNASTAVNPAPTAAHDWDQVCHAAAPALCPTNYGADGTAAHSFVSDTVYGGALFGQGDTIFTGGDAKDIWDLPPALAHHWQWRQTSTTSVQDKDDIEHAYAAQYVVDMTPGNGGDESCGSAGAIANCVLLYFGADRYSNSGASMLGFWFFKNKVGLSPLPSPLPTGGTSTFTGSHSARVGDCQVSCTRGDILILADFLLGGAAPTVRVFEWVGSGGSDGPLDQIGGTDVTPSDCNGAPAPKAQATPVPPVQNDDNLCATINGATVPSPWAFTPKPNTGTANNFSSGMFLEGGINMTALGLGNECFNSFLAESRSSHVVTATLSDFALGNFGSCGATFKTETSKTTLSIGDAAPTDKATISTSSSGGNPPAPDGTTSVSFYLCGPTPAITVCDPTGKTAFDTKLVSTAVKTGNDYAITSSAPTITTAGHYCFAARWPGDANYADGPYGDNGTNECFDVTPKTPTISTQVNTETAVTPGTEVWDSALLGGTASPSNATQGTITFSAFGPKSGLNDCTGTAIYTSVVTIAGDGTYLSKNGTGGAFQPTAPGTYNWIAAYAPATGDVNNIGKSTACSDAHEASVVQKIQPTMTTHQRFVPNDSATVTVAAGAGNLLGNVKFQLFVNNTTCDPNVSAAAYDSGNIDITTGTPNPGTAGLSKTISSGNTTPYDVSGTTFSWLVTYTPAASETGHFGVTATCNAENSSITLANGGTFSSP